MSESKFPEIAGKVDAKSQELIVEFHAYRDGIMAENPNDPKLTDERILFESWTIQKIAGLQCVVLDLVKQVNASPKGK